MVALRSQWRLRQAASFAQWSNGNGTAERREVDLLAGAAVREARSEPATHGTASAQRRRIIGFRSTSEVDIMKPATRAAVCLLRIACCAALPNALHAQAPAPEAAVRDGAHDFDFEFGAWKTHVRRLLHPLTGSSTWAEYDGTSVVHPIWNGRANLVELHAEGSAGKLDVLSLRLYDAQSRQWSSNVAVAGSGSLSPPAIGEFKDGRAEFYDQETFAGRAILVRFVISGITKDSCRFEQAFSGDGGRTWEVNWIATDTRVAGAPPG